MHLAIQAVDLAARVDDGRGVVIQARRAPLEQRRNDRRLQLAGDLAETLCCRTGYRLRKIKERMVFPLAEILSQKQLGQADELRALLHRLANVRDGALQVLFGSGVQDICTIPMVKFFAGQILFLSRRESNDKNSIRYTRRKSRQINGKLQRCSRVDDVASRLYFRVFRNFEHL